MNKEVLKKIGDVLFYLVLIIVVAIFIKRKFIVPKVAISDLELVEIQTNTPIDFTKLDDKVVLVNFWQTWCGPCIHEMPSLNEMSETWDGIIVYCATDEPVEKLGSFIQQYPNIHFVSIDNISALGISQYPTTYIYNKEGVKVFSKIGAKDWADPNFIATLKKNWN